MRLVSIIAQAEPQEANADNFMFYAAIGVVLFIGLAWTAIAYSIGKPWFRCFMSGGRVSVMDIVGMRMRSTNVNLVIDTYLAYLHQERPQTIADLQSCLLGYGAEIHDVKSFMNCFDKKFLKK